MRAQVPETITKEFLRCTSRFGVPVGFDLDAGERVRSGRSSARRSGHWREVYAACGQAFLFCGEGVRMAVRGSRSSRSWAMNRIGAQPFGTAAGTTGDSQANARQLSVGLGMDSRPSRHEISQDRCCLQIRITA
jgi:hypothetical protein